MLNITVVSLMLLMENMDVSIINIAIPAIATDLGLPPLDLKMAITSYLISLAIFVPISGVITCTIGWGLNYFEFQLGVYFLGKCTNWSFWLNSFIFLCG